MLGNNNVPFSHQGILRLIQILEDIRGDKSTRVFARKLGVHHATLMRLLKGEVFPDISTIYKISQISSYKVSELIAIACEEPTEISPIKTAEEAIELIKNIDASQRVKLLRAILQDLPKQERKQVFLKLVDVLID